VDINSYKPLDSIMPFHLSNSEFRLLNGAYDCGKTTAMIWEFIECMCEYPGIAGYMCRKFNDDIEDTTRAIFYRECPPELIEHVEKGGKRCFFKNGSYVIFGGLYTRGKVYQRLKIPVCSLIGVDELAEIDEKDFRDLISRKRSDATAREQLEGKEYPLKFMAASNPPNFDHWMYQKWELDKAPGFKYWELDIYSNPYADKRYIKSLEYEYRNNPSLMRRNLLGKWGFVSHGKPVYSGFSELVHVKELKYNPAKPILRGWDFGFCHPCVAWCQFDNDDRFKVLDVILGQDIHLDQFADKIIKMSNEKYPGCEFQDFCDIEGSYNDDNSDKTSVQILQAKGIFPRFMKTNVLHGVDILVKKINKLIDGQPALQVDKECRLAIEMFMGGYSMAKLPPGSAQKEEPDKDGVYDHISDAIRYIINFFFKVNEGIPVHIECQEPSFFSNENANDTQTRYYR